MNVLVLQHIACEPTALYGEVMAERGVEVVRVQLDRGERLPDRREFDAIVAMGGPMSVNDDAEPPWLTAEKQAIADAVRAGVPYWGSCLGVQLLAAALGARVYPGTQPEVGVLPVTLTDEGQSDPVFAGLPAEFMTLQWHGDTFDVPEGGVLLASSPTFPNQAFRVGRTAYGVQFHVEVTEQMAREWAEVPAYAEYADRVLGAGGIDRLMADFDAARERMLDVGRRMFERWVEIAVAVPR